MDPLRNNWWFSYWRPLYIEIVGLLVPHSPFLYSLAPFRFQQRNLNLSQNIEFQTETKIVCVGSLNRFIELEKNR
jgi:hypothetical protein